MATTSTSGWLTAARSEMRPMRPKPLIPTLMGMMAGGGVLKWLRGGGGTRGCVKTRLRFNVICVVEREEKRCTWGRPTCWDQHLSEKGRKAGQAIPARRNGRMRHQPSESSPTTAFDPNQPRGDSAVTPKTHCDPAS